MKKQMFFESFLSGLTRLDTKAILTDRKLLAKGFPSGMTRMQLIPTGYYFFFLLTMKPVACWLAMITTSLICTRLG